MKLVFYVCVCNCGHTKSYIVASLLLCYEDPRLEQFLISFTVMCVTGRLFCIPCDFGCTNFQRPALIPFHSAELRLIDGEGKWELRSIKQ